MLSSYTILLKKSSKRPYPLEEILLNRHFYLFSTRSPSGQWSSNSQSTIARSFHIILVELVIAEMACVSRNICTTRLESFALFRSNVPFLSAMSRILKITENLTDFIIAVTGISIKSELAGVVHLRTYSCFESLKVRDFRLEPVPRYSFYKRIRKDSQ